MTLHELDGYPRLVETNSGEYGRFVQDRGLSDSDNQLFRIYFFMDGKLPTAG